MRQPSDMPEILRAPLHESHDDGPELRVGGDWQFPAAEQRPPGWSGRRTRRRVLAALPWLLCGLVLLAIAMALRQARHPMEALSPETLAQARARWQALKTHDYELEMEIQGSGMGRAVYHAIIEDDRVIQLELDGQPARSAAPSNYTVPGLLDVLEQELAQANRVEPGDPRRRPLLRARFDPKTGVPVRFLRVIPGTNHNTQWQVIRFERRVRSTAPATASAGAAAGSRAKLAGQSGPEQRRLDVDEQAAEAPAEDLHRADAGHQDQGQHHRVLGRGRGVLMMESAGQRYRLSPCFLAHIIPPMRLKNTYNGFAARCKPEIQKAAESLPEPKKTLWAAPARPPGLRFDVHAAFIYAGAL